MDSLIGLSVFERKLCPKEICPFSRHVVVLIEPIDIV